MLAAAAEAKFETARCQKAVTSANLHFSVYILRITQFTVRQSHSRQMVTPSCSCFKTKPTTSGFKFTICRQQDWQIQNITRTRHNRKWQMLVSMAADALICSTGGFVNASGDSSAEYPGRSSCCLQTLSVFAEPFSELKTRIPSMSAEIDSRNFSDFIYNKAYQCK